VNHESVAEQVLAEVQQQHPEGLQPEAPHEAEPSAEVQAMVDAMAEDGAEVEIEEQAEGEAPKKRGLSWEQAVKSVPPDIAKLMRSMQADYTRKTQELAEQRKDFLAEREALMKGKQALQVPDELPEYDPFNEGSIQARIEAEVTKRLQQVLEPMQAEYEQQQAQDSYRTFLQQHPDFENDNGLRSEVQHLLEENDSLDLETAYWAARGKRARKQQAEQQESRRAKRRAAKEAALKATGTPRRAGVQGRPARGDLKRASAADILAIAQAMHRK
tara:strand:+ start:859 stop:1677 length:819 start_codon:yes stop_codon:yes gene_type:complete